MAFMLCSHWHVGCARVRTYSRARIPDSLVSLGLSDSEAVAACAVAGVCLGLLSAIMVAAQPPPSATDVAKRGKRTQMTNYGKDCGLLQRDFCLGIVLCVMAYTLLGALRGFRDYFQLEVSNGKLKWCPYEITFS